ncbi:MAG: carbonic anhydrase [Clostridia bacterium]|nr:carbonic anhydrase [Clostridia bacterium]
MFKLTKYVLMVFDQALGDLFVVRTAGNVVDPVAIGSVEYALEHLKVPLIVVLGHMKCGAVKATVAGGEAPGSIGAVVAKIKPSFDKVKANGVAGDEAVEETATENVGATIAELKKSPVIKHLLESGKVSIVGAKYHLDTGKVQWFEQ